VGRWEIPHGVLAAVLDYWSGESVVCLMEARRWAWICAWEEEEGGLFYFMNGLGWDRSK